MIVTCVMVMVRRVMPSKELRTFDHAKVGKSQRNTSNFLKTASSNIMQIFLINFTSVDITVPNLWTCVRGPSSQALGRGLRPDLVTLKTSKMLLAIFPAPNCGIHCVCTDIWSKHVRKERDFNLHLPFLYCHVKTNCTKWRICHHLYRHSRIFY